MGYLEWTYDPDAADGTYTVDCVYGLRDSDGTVRVEHDRHIEGLFSRNDWLQVPRATGFETSAVPFEHSEVEAGLVEVFIAVRPGRDR
jgi:hypothetical protein